ncbi:MAG TPA: carbamoyltransferase [Phycisphaerae bacterium]|nr:carbamoyltransferase [Phycisphaerae bacterium]
MNILGISAFYHDSAACLVQDGQLVAAAQEERFTRKKHDFRFPQNAIDYCLAEAGISPGRLDHVVFYDKPLLKFERLLETYLAFAPAGFKSFLEAMPLWIRQKLHLPREMDKGLKHQYKGRYIFTEHHESHAASAFFPSPFDEAAILTIDGVGEWATASYGVGRGNRIDVTHEMHFPHSLGLLYTAFTYYCGFKANSGEYKLMGLAPYGEPIHEKTIREKIIDIKPDGSLRMDMSYFNYCQGLTMTSQKFHDLFGGPPRRPESRLTQREMDLAASIQVVTEDIMLRAARHLHKTTGMKNLCLAGGVALNCVGNGRILRDGPFENIWIQPAAGDAGGALGAALFVWHQLLDKPRKAQPRDGQRASLLGPGFTSETTRGILDAAGAKYHYFDKESELVERIVEAMLSEKVVGHMQGRMEFGPRALGNRSIIGDARSPTMQSVMNLKTKFRESFRPFAPCVMREHVHEYFEMRPEEDSPYMLLVAAVRPDKRTPSDGNPPKAGLEKLKQIRSVVPAITHVDYSARVQTVDSERHPRMHRIMSRFKERTGCPVIINTSFNIRGEPIVCSPKDAYRCFMGCNMDVLVVDNFLMYKEEQPQAKKHEIDAYLSQFALD